MENTRYEHPEGRVTPPGHPTVEILRRFVEGVACSNS